MKNKVILILFILMLVFGIGYVMDNLDSWENEVVVEEASYGNNAGEGGVYKVQILEGGIG